jgi:hypothetical protein
MNSSRDFSAAVGTENETDSDFADGLLPVVLVAGDGICPEAVLSPFKAKRPPIGDSAGVPPRLG